MQFAPQKALDATHGVNGRTKARQQAVLHPHVRPAHVRPAHVLRRIRTARGATVGLDHLHLARREDPGLPYGLARHAQQEAPLDDQEVV